jgi:RNA 2',3'-cyclic 3'-phosphodiesterase
VASVSGSERLRLFCALRLPDDVVTMLVAWQEAHVRAGRVVPADNLHVTLAFLGQRPAAEVPAIAEQLAEAASAADAIVLRPARYRETRSVGMIVLDDLGGAGARLADGVGVRLERIGVYRREDRPWLPHVTVTRFRSRPGLDPPLPELGEVSPSDAAVYVSRLRPSGALYEPLEIAVLGGR